MDYLLLVPALLFSSYGVPIVLLTVVLILEFHVAARFILSRSGRALFRFVVFVVDSKQH